MENLLNKTLTSAILHVEEYVEKREYHKNFTFKGLRGYLVKEDPSEKEVFKTLIEALKKWFFEDYHYFGKKLQYCIKPEHASYILQQFDKEVKNENNEEFSNYVQTLYNQYSI